MLNATPKFLDRQVEALTSLLATRDESITRLQDEVSHKSTVIHTTKAERQNLINTLKEYVIESLRDNEIMEGNAEAIAEICGFELTKTITITATVDFEVEIEVPFDTDSDDVANNLEFSVDAFDYSISDFSIDIQSVQAEDNIS